MQVPTTATTRLPVDRTALIAPWVKRLSRPACSSTAPKASAVMISQTVLSIDSMPPRDSSLSISG
jgi:hypothetical protein